eukprot:symbB.v1.2.009270.t1/scaffold584.1/size184464/5
MAFLVKDDPQCWMYSVNYEMCCRNHYSSSFCWGDPEYPFERCCMPKIGTRVQVLFSELRGFLATNWLQQLLILAALLLGGVQSCSSSKTGPEQERRRQLSAVPQLRLLAMVWIAGFHIWNLLEPLYTPAGSSDDLRFLQALAVVHTDVFFVVSSYLIATRPGKAATFRIASLRVSAKVLHRAVRLAVPAAVAHLLMSTICPALPWSDSAAIWPLCHEFLCYTLLEALTAFPARSGNSIMVLLLALCFHRHRSAPALSWQVGHRVLDIHRIPLCLEVALLAKGLQAVRPCWQWLPSLPLQGPLLWVLFFLGALTTATLEWCLIAGPLVAVPLSLFPLHGKLPLLIGAVLLLEHSNFHATVASSTQEATLSDVLGKFVLPFMLVHVYMLPSNPERMVPGAPVLLEQLWLLLGACVFPAFLVHTVQQPFQRLLSDAVDGAVAFARASTLWLLAVGLAALLSTAAATALACTAWQCLA